MSGRKGMSYRETLDKMNHFIYITVSIEELNERFKKEEKNLVQQGLSIIAELDPELKRRGIKTPFKKYDLNSLAQSQKSYTINPDDEVLTTEEACKHLRISRPTYMKYVQEGRIKAVRAGKGWKVYKSDLQRFLRG